MRNRFQAFTIYLLIFGIYVLSGDRVFAATAQQRCDSSRVNAWKNYKACLERTFGPYAKGTYGYVPAERFTKCRHFYFKRWSRFQGNRAFDGSSCLGPRFIVSGTTLSDNLTLLTWELKTNLDDVEDDMNLHDADNPYAWSQTSAAALEDGSLFGNFALAINAGGFAGAKGWRIPSIAELMTTLIDFACDPIGGCVCPSMPCIDSAFGPTAAGKYWSSTVNLDSSTAASVWDVDFVFGVPRIAEPDAILYARVVRGGLP